MRYFVTSTLVGIIGMVAAFFWGGTAGVVTCLLLTLMEISFSFDNAVVNATVLKDMDDKWQRRFLTWGILVAVFGMRLLFPLLIVSMATGLSIVDVTHMAIDEPASYTQHVLASHVQIGAFGGMFLLMVFLHFIFDDKRELHWLGVVEERLAKLGKLEAMEVVMALVVLLTVQNYIDDAHKLQAMIAGVVGIALYVFVNGATALAGTPEAGKSVTHAGMMGFIYLQFLDASFSLDGVIGAFAISKDIIIIMIGLGVGALYVRSITIYLVKHDTLGKYLYLEHGAHYGIGVLAAIMLISMVQPVPEVVTGVVGLLFIGLSLVSSVLHNRKRLAKAH